MDCAGEPLWRRNSMSTMSRVVVMMLVALGALLSPGTGAVDHVMVTPDALKWMDPPSLPPGGKNWQSSKDRSIKRPPLLFG